MQVKARVLVEPKLDLVMLVGGVVVEDQVEIEGFGRLLIDGAQEAQKLLMAVTPHALSDDRTGGDIKGGEQRSCSMPLIIMGHRAGPPLLDRQPRLGAVERLDLALLIDTQHHGLVGRAEIEADHISELVDKPLVVRQLEAACQMRFEPVCVPDPPHAGLAEADRPSHRPGAPLGRRRRPLVQGFVDHLSDHRRRQRRFAPGPGGIALQPGNPLRHKALLPAPHRRLALAKRANDRHRPDPRRRQQHDARAPHQFLGGVAIRHKTLQPGPIPRGEFNAYPALHTQG